MARTFDPDGGKAYSCNLYNGGEHLFLPELLACFTCISCGVEKHTMQHSQRQREIQGTDVTNGESEAMQNESDTAKRVWENVGILSFHTEQRKPQMRTLWNNRGLFHCPPPFLTDALEFNLQSQSSSLSPEYIVIFSPKYQCL